MNTHRDTAGDGSEPDSAADTTPEIPREDQTFDRTVEEGKQRISRGWLPLIITGFIGGFDVSVGILAFLLVQHYTGNPVLSGLAFATGFITLSIGHSELFTENFLVPVAAVVAKAGTFWQLGRLWTVSLVTNMAGGWLLAALMMLGLPAVRGTAVEFSTKYIDLGVTWTALALAIIGGMLMTLMTHLQKASDSEGVQLVPAVITGFILSIGHINHAVVASLMCFAGLIAGAPFGYLAWLQLLAIATAGNLIGGLALVTVFRLLQVPHKVQEARANSD
ncbi:formate/nitrite transporter family protein [Mycolicibacillus trivialis]